MNPTSKKNLLPSIGCWIAGGRLDCAAGDEVPRLSGTGVGMQFLLRVTLPYRRLRHGRLFLVGTGTLTAMRGELLGLAVLEDVRVAWIVCGSFVQTYHARSSLFQGKSGWPMRMAVAA